MGKSKMEIIDISPCCTEKVKRLIKTTGYAEEEEEEEGTPLRPIFCLKKNRNLKHFEETEDCFILDFDPFESVDISNLSVSKNLDFADDANNDISVLAEKGQVACRDYPHSRHLCLKFPFDTTPHERYCKLCYCYVCDSVAPCNFWTEPGVAGHCHAAEHIDDWKSRRKSMKSVIYKSTTS